MANHPTAVLTNGYPLISQGCLTNQGVPPALPGRQLKFDIFGGPSERLRVVSRQSTRREEKPDGRLRKPKPLQMGV